ncbi:cation:proton antiporter [Myroides odoratimimus]|uniref:cation:proton antiporter n=1 Tax=Myroides odoratimimus TaxID=76832 RepID=UPI0025768DBC|nr:cation:proton antiporter [Myroides odoratimimus]MDM1038083.1 cation:proton antiporter [Myroides odoratimimus]MDM1052234.1 cation:proton antiporter [Myroides odoratimimus]
MSKFKNSLLYFFIIGGCSALMYWVVSKGVKLESNVVKVVSDKSIFENFLDTIQDNLNFPLALLLAQIVTIVLVARVFGWICKKIGQPSVIGEIIAGIALGPSFVGAYFPEFSEALFPVHSLGNLSFLSQIGLILFMFVIGMELDLKVLKNKAHDAVLISHASIIIPFALGMTLAYYIFTSFAPEGVEFLSFGLFLGISMSITAFPVLARIVQERGLQKTRLGTIVITCAAADDITAWCLLAAVIAIVQAGSFASSLYIMALAIIYVIVMLKLVKPFLARIAKYQPTSNMFSKGTVAIFLLTLIISSYCTEVIGIHALFGAFMTGAVMPDNIKIRNIFIEKVEDVAVVLFLPLFFVYTGLRTEIGLLNEPYLWKVTGVIILVATIGKFVGSALTAKIVGISWKDSLTIGALMNTRGLMELIVLNIGFDLGVLTGEVFAMMVIMALATTFMTGPVLDLIAKIFGPLGDDEVKTVTPNLGKYQVSLFFEDKTSLAPLMRLASSFVGKNNADTGITAMHLVDSIEVNAFTSTEYENEIFEAVQEEATALDQEVQTYYKVSNDIESDVVNVVNEQISDLLLIEVGYSIYRGSLLGNILGFTTRIINPDVLLNKVTGKEKFFENSWFNARTQQILNRSKVPVGIFINKDFDKVEQIFLPVFSKQDLKLLSYAQKWIRNSEAQITVLDATGQLESYPEFKEQIRLIEQFKPNHIRIVNAKEVNNEFVKDFNLMLISLESWKTLVEERKTWLNSAPSMLLIQL